MSAERLAAGERRELLLRLAEGAGATGAGFARGAKLIGLLFAGMGLLFVVRGAWAIAGIVVVLGGGIVAIGVVAARKTSPERMRPVLDALRESPDAVITIRHYETSDSARRFVSQWIEVKTADHRLVVKANDDWPQLIECLRRLCPGADVEI